MTLEEIYSVPAPSLTRTYKPVSHKQLIETTKEVCDKMNLNIASERYIANAEGQILTGYFNLDWKQDSEMGVRIAFQNSYNKKVTLKIVSGSEIFVCSNGMLRGNHSAYKRKHTGDIQEVTPRRIEEALCCVEHDFQTLVNHRNQMKQIEVDKKVINELIGDLYIREGIIKETQLSIIKNEIIKPSYDYNADGSLWQIYNHITHSLKGVHAGNFIDVHGDLHEYMVNKFQLV